MQKKRFSMSSGHRYSAKLQNSVGDRLPLHAIAMNKPRAGRAAWRVGAGHVPGETRHGREAARANTFASKRNGPLPSKSQTVGYAAK